MQIDKKETVRQVYRFLKSYHSLVKLSLDGQDGAFEAQAVEIVGMIEVYRDNLDDVRRGDICQSIYKGELERD